MNQSRTVATFARIVLLLLIGAGAVVCAFWLFDHQLALPGTWTMIVILFGVFFVTFTWALFKLLRWRDGRRSRLIKTPTPPQPNSEGTVYGLIPGIEYLVLKSFTDYQGNSFQRSELLHFKERHFLPYHGGHTIIFVERPLYLQEDQNREILDHFSEYITQVKQ
jgi:Domain of unknown function (DUF3601)